MKCLARLQLLQSLEHCQEASASAAKTYTINKPVSDMITVYFTNNNNWSKVYAYTYGD